MINAQLLNKILVNTRLNISQDNKVLAYPSQRLSSTFSPLELQAGRQVGLIEWIVPYEARNTKIGFALLQLQD